MNNFWCITYYSTYLFVHTLNASVTRVDEKFTKLNKVLTLMSDVYGIVLLIYSCTPLNTIILLIYSSMFIEIRSQNFNWYYNIITTITFFTFVSKINFQSSVFSYLLSILFSRSFVYIFHSARMDKKQK